ncbi:MAG: amino acid ABC transporter permease [Nocardioidaceae bacterium]
MCRVQGRGDATSILAAVFGLLLLFVVFWVVQRLIAEKVLTADAFNATFQNRFLTAVLEGFIATLKAAGLAILTSLLAGALLASGRLSNHAIVRWPCTAFIEFFRAVPLLLLFFFIFFAYESRIGLLLTVVLALTLYNGSVLAEVFRAGVNAVPKGQSEAAYSLGMRKTQVMNLILMPQAVRFMLPAIVSQCVVVLKDTTLGALITYEEVVRTAQGIRLSPGAEPLLIFGLVALIFILINYSLGKLAEFLERRLSRRGQSTVDRLTIEPGMGAGAA